MKILLVSMNSIHFQRWAEQLKDSNHDVYWFNILDGDYIERLSWVTQFNGWKHKYPYLKGRHFAKNKLPKLYNKLSKLIENDTAKAFEDIVDSVRPDVVHSFVFYISCAPIYSVMLRYKDLPWIYSSWGSDLYYFRNIPEYRANLDKILPRINYLFTDCKRDVTIAKALGFTGKLLGTFPGGGGFDIDALTQFITPVNTRDIILIKGYQGRSGKCIEVLKALIMLKSTLKDYTIVVFGADVEVLEFQRAQKLKDKFHIIVHSKEQQLAHIEVLKLMGKALIYIGNSDSDGMPNTLLEAIIMGAFPIQSNPGGASAEIINDKENGLLIEDHNDIEGIKNSIGIALSNRMLIEKAFKINQEDVKPTLERTKITSEVLKKYDTINTNI